MKITWITSIVTLLLIQVGFAQSSGIPQWVFDHWESQTHQSGTWIADNAKYKNETEPIDAFGLKWEYGIGKKHLKGILFSIKNGENIGDVWEFTEYWDATKNELRVVQIGRDGTVGQGKIWQEDGILKEEQTFVSPSGQSSRFGHKNWMENGEQHTQSFSIVDGTWNKRRFYVWKLQGNKTPEISKVYDDVKYLIGKWEIKINENASSIMVFEWANNGQNIHYSTSYKPNQNQAYQVENTGIMTYHGVKNQVVFLNTYTGYEKHLISEGYYDIQKDGAIHRIFTCHYEEGDGLPWSNGALAPKGGTSIDFKQIWIPIDQNSFSGDFFWKKNGKWVHPIKEYDKPNFKEVWRRIE